MKDLDVQCMLLNLLQRMEVRAALKLLKSCEEKLGRTNIEQNLQLLLQGKKMLTNTKENSMFLPYLNITFL